MGLYGLIFPTCFHRYYAKYVILHREVMRPVVLRAAGSDGTAAVTAEPEAPIWDAEIIRRGAVVVAGAMVACEWRPAYVWWWSLVDVGLGTKKRLPMGIICRRCSWRVRCIGAHAVLTARCLPPRIPGAMDTSGYVVVSPDGMMRDFVAWAWIYSAMVPLALFCAGVTVETYRIIRRTQVRLATRTCRNFFSRFFFFVFSIP